MLDFIDKLDTQIFRNIDKRIESSSPGRWFTKMQLSLTPKVDYIYPATTLDLVATFALGALAVTVACWMMSYFPHNLYRDGSFNVWFQADQLRVLGALNDRSSIFHYRDSVHPLFSLLTYPLVATLKSFGLSTLLAGLALVAASAFVCSGLLYLSLRHLGFSMLDSSLACLVFMSSATFFHWFSILETYALSSLTAILAIYIFIRVKHVGATPAVVASAISLSMVTTNWILGIALVTMKFPLAKAVRYTLIALAICIGASVAQKKIFPSADYFFTSRAISTERFYASLGDKNNAASPASAILSRLKSVMITSAIAPTPYIEKQGDYQVITNQYSTLSNYGAIGLIASGSWSLMLALAIFNTVIRLRVSPIIAALGTFLFSQLALHSIYGEVTFLYSSDYFIVLVFLTTYASVGGLRIFYRILAIIFVIFGSITNISSFSGAIVLLKSII